MVSSIDKAIKLISSNIGIELVITQRDKLIRVKSKDIIYIEVADHKLTYHTQKDKIIDYGSLTNLEKTLKPNNFMRCNACYLVNPKYIDYVEGFFVYMKNGDALKISRPRKKKFMLDLTEWLGKGNFS